MPMPKPKKDETMDDFMARFMADETMMMEYPEEKQRQAMGKKQWEAMHAEFSGFDDWVPIFRGGKQVDGAGREHDGDALIDKALVKFNVARHEPPITIGHPADNAPAYGWVKGLKKGADKIGNLLLAKFKQVEPTFAGMVKAGRYKKRSAAFYPDGSLRHVGFLGAAPPAVKGLPDMAFSEPADAVFEFSEDWKWTSLADVFRRMREWLIEKFDQDTADRIVPNWTIEDIRAAPREDAAETMPMNQYREKEETAMDFKEFLQKLKDLLTFAEKGAPAPPASGLTFSEADLETARRKAAEEAAQKERLKVTAEFAEKDRLSRTEARRREITAWCEAMVKAGKMTPAMVKFGLPEFMTAFAEKDDVIEFGETKEKATLYDRFKAFWEAEMPKVVEFKEIATRGKDTGGQGDAGAKLTVLTQQKMKDNKDLTYSAAFAEVQRENPDLAKEYAAEFKEV